MRVTKDDINRWIKEGKISFYKVGLCLSLSFSAVLSLKELDRKLGEYHANMDKSIFYTMDELATKREIGRNDISKINDMENVKELYIYDDGKLELNQINGFKLPDNVRIEIHGKEDEVIRFDEKRYGFLKDVKSIEKLMLGNDVTIDSNFLESLTNVKNLEIYVSNRTNLNYKDMTYLKSLSLHGFPYDVAMFISSKDLEGLETAGVDVQYNFMEYLANINNKIDKIVESLEVDENSTDIEKINAAIEWILKNYSYDPEVARLLKEGKNKEIDHSPFYGFGTLYGGLENETQICGNYAAMTNALMHRLGIKTYITKMTGHAWNLINLDDNYYYLDTTDLDDAEVVDFDIRINRIVESPEGARMQFSGPIPQGFKIISADVTSISKPLTIDEALEGKSQDDIDKFIGEGYLIDVNETNSYTDKLLFSPVDDEITNYVKKEKELSKVELVKIKFNNNIYLVPAALTMLFRLMTDLLAMKHFEEDEKEKTLEKVK